MKRGWILDRMLRLLTVFLAVAGGMGLVILALSFSSRPFYTHHWLGTGIQNSCSEPGLIVLLGAGGMPSGENMMRIYYAAEAWKQFSHCNIFLSLPGDTADEKGSIALMKQELIMRGVSPEKIRYEAKGKNTRGQALELAGMDNGGLLQACALVITSPGHMRRSILTFRKAGFHFLIPLPAFEIPLEGELRFDDDELGGERRFVAPSTGQTLTLRYEIWTQLNYQLVCAREFVALGYYWLRGWI